MSRERRECRNAAAVCLLGVVLLAVGSRSAEAQLSNADKQALADMALQWAADGGIPDVKLLPNPTTLLVVNQNLPPRTTLHVANRTVMLESPLRIQVIADVAGDVMYFRLGPFAGEKGRASVAVALVWAVGVSSKAAYLSGGGATLQFEKRDGQWTLLPVNERWAS
jgi:hypothetical protein